jgi:hypothetical protein
MKKFVKRICIFSAILLAYFGFNFIFNIIQIRTQPELKNVKVLVVGDSRMMTAINPEMIDSCKNIAQNTESYLVSFYKLKTILARENNIQTILLGFSYSSLSKYLDNVFNNDIATTDIFERIYPIMKPGDFGNLSLNRKEFYKVFFKRVFLYPHRDHHHYIGEFVKLKYGLDKAKLAPVIKRHFYDNHGINIGRSEIALNYLDSIVELTKKHHINLVLVNAPLQRDYLKWIPQNFVDYYQYVKTMEIQKGIKVLDYGHLPLEDKNFKDYNHLDEEGANYFTEIIKKDLPE